MRSLIGKRICHATSNHQSDDDRIFFKEARSLMRVGADVTILCGDHTQPPVDQFGVTYEIYHGGGSIRRRLVTIGQLEKALRTENYDVIHCHEPDALFAALRVKALRPVKVVFDSHEMWGATLAQRFPSWTWGAVQSAYRPLESRLLKHCDWGIGATWSISDYLAESLGRERVSTILNVPDASLFSPPAPKSWDGEIIFCHDGHLNSDRGLPTMLEAFRLVSANQNVRFKIIGDVYGNDREWLDLFIEKHGLHDKIIRTGWLPYQDVGQALAPCHVGLIGLTRKPNNEYSMPNKLFNYLLYGIPFIGPDFCFDQRTLLEKHKCGLLVNTLSPQSIADAMNWFLKNRSMAEDMSKVARQASCYEYTWQHMELELLNAYSRLL